MVVLAGAACGSRTGLSTGHYVDAAEPPMDAVDAPASQRPLELAPRRWGGCARMSGGGVVCWGMNDFDNLGTGPNPSPPKPTRGGPYVDVATSEVTICGLTAAGVVECWGYNQFGEVGTGLRTPDVVRSPVPVLRGAALLPGRGFRRGSCAVMNDGTIQCWGYTGMGETCSRDEGVAMPPREVAPLAHASELAIGNYFVCARFGERVRCCGKGNSGQLGGGDFIPFSNTPVAVLGLTDVAEIASGFAHICARKNDGSVWCWGLGRDGQVGDGGAQDRASPVRVEGISSAKSLGMGSFHSCAILSDDSAACWGRNTSGQLGDRSVTWRSTPVAVVGVSGITQIAGGDDHTCARLESNRIVCWGANRFGQLGDGTTRDSLVPVDVALP